MAASLGRKITPKQRSIWEEEKARGKRKFVLQRGLSLGVLLATLWSISFWMRFGRHYADRSLAMRNFCIGIAFFLVGAITQFLYIWRAMQKLSNENHTPVDSN